MKIYTIIGGVNGTGKSSLTGALKSERTDLGVIIDVDKLTAITGDAVEASRKAIQKINDCLSRDISFTQETTLSGARTEKTIKIAKAQGYKIRLYYVGLNSVEDSLQRIKNRVFKGGHDIPQDDVLRRYNTRFDDLIRILPYCNEATFFDNDNGFAEVAEYKNGELILKGERSAHWIKELGKLLESDY